MDKHLLEAKIRYQVACEEKAHHLVLQLLEPGITEDELVNAGLYLTPNHYQDITEERAISRICGYPVCVNQITKNFCSNECYKASVYYQKQISTSPLWSRKEEKPTPIDLLPKEMNR
uniref:RNA polymerase II subunit B1 CTD phosphatase RPAP2 homolog n=1 Tax=Magallana gigas TaxID=29159 RepID=A0A8W8KNM2_MAGGI